MKKRSCDTLRLFFALWPDAAARQALAAWQAPLQAGCGGRAMRPNTLHCTLLFLGAVAATRLESLHLAAEEVRGAPFALTFDVARYWKHNHIVHAAPNVVPQALFDLVDSLAHCLRRHRFDFDARPYQPHVTLLRQARWDERPLPALPAVHWRADDFVLVQSLSDAEGARYQTLMRFPLTG